MSQTRPHTPSRTHTTHASYQTPTHHIPQHTHPTPHRGSARERDQEREGPGHEAPWWVMGEAWMTECEKNPSNLHIT